MFLLVEEGRGHMAAIEQAELVEHLQWLRTLDVQGRGSVKALLDAETRETVVAAAIDGYLSKHGRLPTASQLSGLLCDVIPTRTLRWHLAKRR
jgi:hypothetical protein